MQAQLLSAITPGIPKWRVARLDNYSQITIDIDGDRIADLSHGDVCDRFLKAAEPHVDIERFDVKKYTASALHRQVVTLAKRIKHGHRFDAIQTSLGAPVTYAHDDGLPATPITPQNHTRHRNRIMKFLSVTNFHTFMVLQRIQRQGIPVYFSTSNKPSEDFNCWNLVKGAIHVGSLDENGRFLVPKHLQPSVTRWEQGVFDVIKVKDGYDITGDGQADVFDHEVSTQGKQPLGTVVNTKVGSSYATPTALGKDLLRKRLERIAFELERRCWLGETITMPPIV